MGRRHSKIRCGKCFLHHELCTCAQMPRIHTQSKVVIIQNYKESYRPTSSGTLATKILSNSERHLYGLPGQPFDASIFERYPNAIALYPHEKAQSITTIDALPFPVSHIFFLDGTWSEARRLMSRLKIADRMPCFTLETASPTNWHVRDSAHEGGLATLEAIAETLGIIENPLVKQQLLDYFYLVTLQIFKMRGKKHPTLSA